MGAMVSASPQADRQRVSVNQQYWFVGVVFGLTFEDRDKSKIIITAAVN